MNIRDDIKNTPGDLDEEEEDDDDFLDEEDEMDPEDYRRELAVWQSHETCLVMTRDGMEVAVHVEVADLVRTLNKSGFEVYSGKIDDDYGWAIFSFADYKDMIKLNHLAKRDKVLRNLMRHEIRWELDFINTGGGLGIPLDVLEDVQRELLRLVGGLTLA